MKMKDFDNWPVTTEPARLLYQNIVTDRVPHASLFLGSAGKTKQLAMFVSQVLLCQGDEAPCEICPGCLQFKAGTHPDFTFVDGYESSVKTADIGSLQEQVSRRTHHGGRFVYFIHGMETANLTASNRLLKTLEEPNTAVIALLTTPFLQQIIPTIQSRCFQYRIDDVDVAPWDDPFPSVDVEPSDNHVNLTFVTISSAMLKWYEDMLKHSSGALELAKRFHTDFHGFEQNHALHLLLTVMRDTMHVHMQQVNRVRFPSLLVEYEQLGQRISYNRYAQMVGVVLDSKSRIRSNVNALLNLEQMCIRLKHI